MERIEKLPVISWAVVHPRLAAWIVLSVGMIVLLVIEARDVGLLATQWVALIVACILVAGACVWIISWEEDDEEVSPIAETSASSTTATVATTETPEPASTDYTEDNEPEANSEEK